MTTEPDEQPQKGSKLSKGADRLILEQMMPSPHLAFSCNDVQLDELQKNAVFALDTSALLAAYRFNAVQANDISLRYKNLVQVNRLFVPARAAQEFARNRPTVLKDTYEALHNAPSTLEKAPVLTLFQCPLLEGRTDYADLLNAANALRDSRDAYIRALSKVKGTLKDWRWDDPISKLYNELFTEKLICSHDMPKESLFAEHDHRFAHNIPPGYKDKAKPDGGIGDLIIWYSLIKLAKDQACPVIFVCNEEKPDWVIRVQNEVLAIRPELAYEFTQKSGQQFGFVNFPEFLKLAGATEETITQAKHISSDINAFEAFEKMHFGRCLEQVCDVAGRLPEHSKGAALDEAFIFRDFTLVVESLRQAAKAVMRHNLLFDEVSIISEILECLAHLENACDDLIKNMEMAKDSQEVAALAIPLRRLINRLRTLESRWDDV
jgi:hypothetical protein